MSGDLISRSALGICKCNSEAFENKAYADGWNSAIAIIENAPAIDAVDVVRCKDCSVPHNKWTGCPNLNGLIPPPDFFCARGERREENGNL